jgi:hypothetical protein
VHSRMLVNLSCELRFQVSENKSADLRVSLKKRGKITMLDPKLKVA